MALMGQFGNGRVWIGWVNVTTLARAIDFRTMLCRFNPLRPGVVSRAYKSGSRRTLERRRLSDLLTLRNRTLQRSPNRLRVRSDKWRRQSVPDHRGDSFFPVREKE
jgi:hypothetical protein